MIDANQKKEPFFFSKEQFKEISLDYHPEKTATLLSKIFETTNEVGPEDKKLLYNAALYHHLKSEASEKNSAPSFPEKIEGIIKEVEELTPDNENKILNASEEARIIKLAEILVELEEIISSYMFFDLDQIRNFYLPVLERWRRTLILTKFSKYFQTSVSLIHDIELLTEKLYGRLGQFWQYDYFHEFFNWLSEYLSSLSSKQIRYKDVIIDFPHILGKDENFWFKALSMGESYTAQVNLLLDINGEDYEVPYFNLPLVTPRGTFVIEGVECLPQKKFSLVNNNSPKFTDLERMRDLRGFYVKEFNYYEYMKKSLQKEVEKYTKKFTLAEYLVHPYISGGLDRFIRLFHTKKGHERFIFFDSTNPLSEIEHRRKIVFTRGIQSKSGRDIHPTHYGRVCLLETPESEAIGIKLHLAHKAKITEDGKILSPLKNNKGTIKFFSPEAEPSPVGDFICYETNSEEIMVRGEPDAKKVKKAEVEWTDAFLDQLFGYAALQIPFVNHNDPARALMGSKNLKQAVPLVNSEPPLVQTGYEKIVAEIAEGIIRSYIQGTVKSIDKDKIVIKTRLGEEVMFYLPKSPFSVASRIPFSFIPRVKKGEKIEPGKILAERTGINNGKVSLGANFLVAYMPYYGYNMDDAIVVSKSAAEKLKSLHVITKEYKVSSDAILEEHIDLDKKIDENTIIAIFSELRKDADFYEDEFENKNTPDSLKDQIEKLLNSNHIKIKNYSENSLEWLNEVLRIPNLKEIIDIQPPFPKKIEKLLKETLYARGRTFEDLDPDKQNRIKLLNRLIIERMPTLYPKVPKMKTKIRRVIRSEPDMRGCRVINLRVFIEDDRQILKVSIEKERPLEVGDKLTGRHGNKGVVSCILPDKNMPYLNIKGEKKYVEVIFNPHSIISRMNLGQVLETHYGWVAREHPDEDTRKKAEMAGKPFAKSDLKSLSKWLEEAGLNEKGMGILYRNGNPLTNNPVTVGYQYLVKLNHLACDKLSIRGNDGPVSYITGMPLGGKRFIGGQRLGEMEAWAILSQNGENLIEQFFGERSNACIIDDSGHISISESIKALTYFWRGLGVCFELLDEDGEIIVPERYAETKLMDVKKYRIRFADSKDIFKWGKNLNNLHELNSMEKDEMGYITLSEAVTLLGKEVNYLPVIPLRCRPHKKSKLTKLYRKILVDNISTKKDKKTILQKRVKLLEKEILSYVTGKQGIIRKAILGRRVNLSARGVIVPDPKIKPYEVRIPLDIMWIFGEESKKVLLNRQPTLHPHNLQMFSTLSWNHKAIGVNPLICSGFNADFDGDTMSVYKTGYKIPDYMDALNNALLRANGKPNINISQDIVTGLYLLSQTQEGRENIAKCINDDEIYNSGHGQIDKRKAESILKLYFLKCESKKKFFDFAHELMCLGLKIATEKGFSLSIFDFTDLSLNETQKQDCLKDTAPEEKTEEFIRQNIKSCKTENPIAIMLLSGARGDLSNVKQMVGMKGFVEKMGGQKTNEIVFSSYLEGLSPTEYYLASFGARKSLGDKKLVTPDAGYLTRRLVFAIGDIKIQGQDDCGAEGIRLSIENCLGRYGKIDSNWCLLDENKISELKKKHVKEIEVRSPLTCKNDSGICQVCYGWELGTRKVPPPGFAAGILSAEVIGERATQDAMRSYHSGKATKTISKFSIAKAIFDNTIIPDNQKRPSEIIEEAGSKIDALMTLAHKLHEDVYEKKVDIKHYEVALKGLMYKGVYLGTYKMIKNKHPLHQLFFSCTSNSIQNFAEKNASEEFNSPLEKLFI